MAAGAVPGGAGSMPLHSPSAVQSMIEPSAPDANARPWSPAGRAARQLMACGGPPIIASGEAWTTSLSRRAWRHSWMRPLSLPLASVPSGRHATSFT
eukprot:4235046-Prymnesium_polylepis.2